ncbi:uncharacterized protein LAESUDRAFT_692112 [Laetiporus sulphureus 93-53]|uniref:Uncharacterized protein n=1 Tax=Laetiporus sulphureus 93-53 TaxID=1314785 RepID=A0A165H7P5_9APHY|nr:uncharacterized protein LAESUDRAFT_692112 [Laetiporus sulphureus 93-53]KZT11358.1 hypothetical protein LAESUDRAFT_692112 [Laetiporus sulphureus 93-53]
MSKPIVLWHPQAILSSDDACTTILKYALPTTSSAAAPYHSAFTAGRPLSYVPPLTYFCIQKVLDFPDQVHALGRARLSYRAAGSPDVYDPLRALIPEYRDNKSFDLTRVDPRLWSLIVQLYYGVPDAFRHYVLPLSDEHLPLLQRIPSTPEFALLTVLELPCCAELTDDNVIELKALHGLCAFDASGTALSAWGIKRLSKTLTFAEDEEQGDDSSATARRGPWGLRILGLRHCMSIKSDVFDCLTNFPLLCVVDLRGTRCVQNNPGPFRPSKESILFNTASMAEALDQLAQLHSPSSLFSNPHPYFLLIDSLYHHATPFTMRGSLESSETTELQLLSRGRKDVFLPYQPRPPSPDIFRGISDEGDDFDDDARDTSDNDDDSSAENSPASVSGEEDGTDDEFGDDESQSEDGYGLTFSDDDIDSAEENFAAGQEAYLHAQRQAALRFYENPSAARTAPSERMPSLSSMLPRVDSSAVPAGSRSHAAQEAAADPFMLARPPPPWSSLPKSLAEWKARIRESQERPSKRARVGDRLVDGNAVRSDGARNHARVEQNVRKMQAAVRARKAAAARIQEEKSGASGQKVPSANPFLRKKQTARSTRREGRDCVLPRESVKDAAIISSDNTGRTNKPLQPISQLKVPTIPAECRPRSRDKTTAPKLSKRRSSIQTTLPALIKARSTETLQVKSPKPDEDHSNIDKVKIRPGDKGGKAASKGHVTDGRFDWRRWSDVGVRRPR